ncbi:MAG: GNAT family N-acetyltransferase [Alphaproteobacteria bacterium]
MAKTAREARGAPVASSLVIRDATERDMEAVQVIYAHHVLHGYGSFEESPPSAAEMAGRFAEVRARGLPYLIAELDGGVAGYSYAQPYRGRSAYRYSVEDSVYVTPRAVGRGVGRALLGLLIERCAALGLRQMVGVIGDSRNLPSIRLHEQLGFVRAGVLADIGFKRGRWIDSVLMQRALGPGSIRAPDGAGTAGPIDAIEGAA